MSASARSITGMSVDEFLAWDAPQPWKWNLVDGQPIAMAPPGVMHGAIQSEVGSIIRNHLRQRRSPCIVVTGAGVVPRAGGDANIRIPELAVTCNILDRQAPALRAPVLVIEILSRSNEAATRANIWTYISVPSVREVLLLRADTVTAELLRRDAEGNWPEQATLLGEDDGLELASIGLTFKLLDAYATPPLAREEEDRALPGPAGA